MIQIDALEFDVNLLHENCRNYNDEGSAIVFAAEQLRSEFHKVIRPTDHAAAPVTAPAEENVAKTSGGNSRSDAKYVDLFFSSVLLLAF